MSADKPAKAGKDTIYIDLDDEITSIIDKVENAKSDVVALVLPKRATVLQSIVNMRLLKRATEKANKEVVLVTSESAISPLAGAAGLHVAKNLQSKPVIPVSPIPVGGSEAPQAETREAEEEPAELGEPEEEAEVPAKIDYDKPIGELAAAHDGDEAIDLDDESDGEKTKAEKKAAKPTKDKRLKIPDFDKFRLMLGGGLLLLIGLIVFMFFAVKVLPKAAITIKTTSIPVLADFNATADGNTKTYDEAKAVLPATLQSKDQTVTQNVNATGQQNNGDKATGSVTMSAGACSATVPADVVAGSGLSNNGLTFITQQKTSFAPVVAGGKCTFQSTSATPITAQGGGSKYNLSSATFSVAGRSDVSASGSTSGGTDNNTTVLSQGDVDAVKQKLTSAETDKFTKDFKKSLDDQGYYIIDSTYKLSDPTVTSTPAVGQPATTASVTAKINHSVLTIRKDDLRKLTTAQLNKQIDTKTQKISSSDVLSGLGVSVLSQSAPNVAALKVSSNTTAVPILDIPGIKKSVGGKKEGDIRNDLSRIQGVKEVDVKMSPFWVSKAPAKPSKITVIEQQAQSSGNTSP